MAGQVVKSYVSMSGACPDERRDGSKWFMQFLVLFPEQFNGQYDQAKNKDQQADTVNAVHVTDPFAFRPVRILFIQVEILGYLIPDAHNIKSKGKSKKSNLNPIIS